VAYECSRLNRGSGWSDAGRLWSTEESAGKANDRRRHHGSRDAETYPLEPADVLRYLPARTAVRCSVPTCAAFAEQLVAEDCRAADCPELSGRMAEA